MRFFICLLCVLLCLSPAAKAGEPTFSHHGIAKDAERYETYLQANWKPGTRKAAEIKTAGDRALATDPRAAARNYATAVVADDKHAEAWLGLARALLAIEPDPAKPERYDLPVNASGAAYRAYERAKDPFVKAKALAVMADALVRRSYWRPALDALKTSLALSDDTTVRATYEKLRNEHGFRMTDYRADSEAASPRFCAQFSERLSSGQVDFAKFVSIDGKDPQGITPEGNQLCIEGLAHGQRYEIQLRPGLPSDVGEVLEKPVELAVYVPDRKPFVRFTGKSYVLPSRGQQGIPVVTVNTQRIVVEVYRIGDRSLAQALDDGRLQSQLSSYELETLRNKTGQRVYEGEMEVPSRLNEEVTTAFPVSDAIGALKPGAYAMVARPSDKKDDNGGELATQWFIVSDLGLTALSGQDGIHAFVRSLAEANPVAQASLKLVARNNEILGLAKTDASGYARFETGLANGEGGLQPAILIAENEAGEYAFLDLTETAFDLTDRGVTGREAPGPLDGYLYTDRGVYRPGEDVHLTTLVRDNAGNAATLPVTLIIDRPDGVEHRRYTLSDHGLGGRTLTLSLGSGVMTGTWRAKVAADPKADPIAQVSFLVEDFVPERMELTLEPGTSALKPEELATVKAAGRYLYGPPAAGLALEGDMVVKTSKRDVAGYPGYHFGLADETVNPVRKALEDLPMTAADGKDAVPVMLPAVPKTAKPLEADVIIRLREPGGRTVERSVTLPVELGEARIGIKPQFGTEGAPENGTASFEIVHIDGAGKQVAATGANWTLLRLETNWQWYNRDGSWSYEAVTLTRRAASGALDVLADAPAKIEARVSYGRYRLEVSAPGSEGPASSLTFNAGWYGNEETADSPEMLDVALDKATYKAGETAKLRIASKQGGKALVAVLGNGLLAMQEAEIAKGGGEVAIPVSGDWGSGAYVTALLYRPMDVKAKRMPGRAIGVRWIGLDQSPRTLKIALETPEAVKPGTTLSVPVKIAGLNPGEEARVTVAAVDVGILNLTRFEMPAPDRWFYAQRRLGTEIRDFYGRLIDGMRAERGKLRSGGDEGGGMELQGSPPVEATLALFSGIVTVGADGTAKADFELPDFNGTVRLMAVAWSANKLGHATRDVIVRDALALTVSGPRFLTLGDEARLELDIHNVEGPAAAYQVTVDETATESGEGQPKQIADRSVGLKPQERKTEAITVKPADVGLYGYHVHVKGPGGIDVKRHLTFDVKPPAGDIKRTTSSQLAAKGGKITLSHDLVAELIAGRSRVTVSVGPAAALDVPGLLSALDRYPYGCAEQTVSRALPLVYANAVAAAIGLAPDKELRERVQKAVDRVFEMQDSSGAFGLWGPSNADLWLTAYVTDFLTRAREAGYAVRPLGFTQALDRLQNFISYTQDGAEAAQSRAYALYVLARNGRAPVGELRYWADTKLDSFSTPLAKAQLGAALGMIGDKERAERTFKAALDSLGGTEKDVSWRPDYGSGLRDGAALVTLAAESHLAKLEAPRLVNVVSKAYLSRTYTSTQEQAWMLLAANALGEEAKETILDVNGKTQKGSLIRSIPVADLKTGSVTITNNGDAAVDAVVTVIGAALTPEPPVSKGFNVERSYYTLEGKKVELKSAEGGTADLRQNDRLVVVLTVAAKEAGGRVLLVDRLPAGLEIENPRLVESGDVKSFDWLKTSIRPEHTEFRDDRFVAAFDFSGANISRNGSLEDSSGESAAAAPSTTAAVAYVVRAVTPGSYVHPAATVEDMYRPERHARTASGKLVVTAKD